MKLPYHVKFCAAPLSPPPGIILPSIILPPRNGLMIYANLPCRVSFYPSIILPPYHFPPPHHFAPWIHFAPISVCPLSFCPLKSFNVHYLPMSHIILPPYHFAPVSFCPHIILPPGNCFMIFTITPCPVSFCPLSFCPLFFCPYHFAPWKWFNDLHHLLMSRIILPPALDFVFILIKSPLQLKLMTGAHPVTVAPLVLTTIDSISIWEGGAFWKQYPDRIITCKFNFVYKFSAPHS